MEVVPAAHMLHWPVATKAVPAVLIRPVAHGLQVVAVLPVDAVPPFKVVVLPVGQFLQLVAPAVASVAGASTYLPLPQASHAAAVNASSLNWPAAQLLQMLAPDAVPPVEDLPAPHVVQAAPLDEILPTTQFVQADTAVLPFSSVDAPAAHLVQVVWPFATSAATHLPTMQSVHAAPNAEILPASQTMHVLVDGPIAADFPAAQLVHAAPLVAILPTTQFVQADSAVLPCPPVDVPA